MQPQSTLKKLPNSAVEIEVVIPTDDFMRFETAAIERLNNRYEIPGFRKGKATRDALANHVGDMAFLEEMAELAFNEAYHLLVAEHKLDPIGRPEIQLTKIARGNPLEFRIITAVVPPITLPDYKTIAKEAMTKEFPTEVTDADVEKTILEVRQMRAHQDLHKDGNDSHDHGDALEEHNLPPLDDTFVKTLGKFENVEDFKTKIRENIALEKVREAKDKKRVFLLDSLLEKVTAEVPDIMVKAEQEKMFTRMQAELEQSGLAIDEYLKHLKKTKEEIMEGWKTEAHKQATVELIVDAIAKAENLTPKEEEVTAKIEELLKVYPEADPNTARAYIVHMLTNQNVIVFLENQK